MKRFFFIVAALTLTASTAYTEQPYEPKKLSIDQVLQPPRYERPPISLPDFEMTGMRSVVNGSRLDFEMTYDVDYWELVEWFEDHWNNRKPVSMLDPTVFPHAKNPELLIFGKAGHDGGTQFVLGHPDLPYRFRLLITPDDQSRAVVTLYNAVYSAVYGGIMPARAPFQPAGKTDPIPFRWN